MSNEDTPRIKVGGIVQLVPSRTAVEQAMELAKQLPLDAIALKPEDFHVTLWKLTKEERKRVEAGVRLDAIGPWFTPDARPAGLIRVINRPERMLGGKLVAPRASWVVGTDKQRELRLAVDALARSAGLVLSDYERRRPFHFSLGNLTGSPFDSIGDVEPEEVT